MSRDVHICTHWRAATAYIICYLTSPPQFAILPMKTFSGHMYLRFSVVGACSRAWGGRQVSWSTHASLQSSHSTVFVNVLSIFSHFTIFDITEAYISNALFISLLISKLFCTKGCMGGDIVNLLHPAREGGGLWGDNGIYFVPPRPPPPPISKGIPSQLHGTVWAGLGRGALPPPLPIP